ncbi:MAG TPA: AraC family transcriptional regulator [Candidatus Angelobacter sp.]|nr:AraC family transcriptional regulator [Candidatus Angelobacter sp.]
MLDIENCNPKRMDTMELHSLAIRRVISTIRSRLDENISLSEMAAVAYMSRSHFNRTFRQLTGLPPRRFLSKLRVEAATRMLLNSDSSVTDICMDVGYSSLGTFVRRFSGVLGISPSKLRMLRRSPAKNLLDHVDSESRVDAQCQSAAVTGQIHAPHGFSGAIFIGLFSNPIPEGAPVACATLLQPGEFEVPMLSKGRYYIFALGLPWPDSMDGFFRYENALRGGGQAITLNHQNVDCGGISLREAAATDPPVLLNLPFLLGKKRETSRVV